ncbi:unnamed protein product [Heligmosomoides polygyrus]|uniref:Uncharacterized protein n=1 Tax=Heligmosomoides polygyrus TaxID=6339 RepID=A0A183G1A9_HELPZ|nr:unnamed protein product [Heligmosomoides polygyrus]
MRLSGPPHGPKVSQHTVNHSEDSSQECSRTRFKRQCGSAERLGDFDEHLDDFSDAVPGERPDAHRQRRSVDLARRRRLDQSFCSPCLLLRHDRANIQLSCEIT